MHDGPVAHQPEHPGLVPQAPGGVLGRVAWQGLVQHLEGHGLAEASRGQHVRQVDHAEAAAAQAVLDRVAPSDLLFLAHARLSRL